MRRGRARVLVADAARAEVARPALARLERDRRLHPLLRRGGRAPQRVAEVGALRLGRAQRLERRQQRVDHRLVLGLGLAAHLHALDARVERRGPAGEVELAPAGARRPHLQEQRAVERAGGAADLRDERHPDRLQQRADVVALGRLELLHGRAHPAVHVRAVVAVADRRVELDQLGAVLGDRRREGADPGAHLGGRDAHPQRRAGVSTGASHSRVSSSSSLSSVIEQPAISSDVM